MIKQLLINGAVNRYALSNRARQAIAFQYITDTQTLRLIDTYNNVALDLVANGDNSLTSSAMQKIWQYLEPKVDTKTGGAFHFRGSVDSLDDVTNPKPGDVYQVALSTGRYNPETGQLIPSTVQWNDKEFAWAEKTDPNTGLPIGGQWVELGFNMDGNQGVTEQWVKDYFVGQWQEQEVLSGIIAHTQLSTQLQTREEAIGEHAIINNTITTTAQQIYEYIDSKNNNVEEMIATASANIIGYVNNTVSTSIIYYVNEKISELSGAVNDLRNYSDTKDSELSTAIQTLSTYVDQRDGQLSTVIDNFSAYVLDRMDVADGGFVTNNAFNTTINNVVAQHQKDLTFILYDDNGDPINL